MLLSQGVEGSLAVLAVLPLLPRLWQQALLSLDVRESHLAKLRGVAATKGFPIASLDALLHKLWVPEVDEGIAQIRPPGGAARDVDEVVGAGEADVVQGVSDVLLRVPASDVAQHHRGGRQVIVIARVLILLLSLRRHLTWGEPWWRAHLVDDQLIPQLQVTKRRIRQKGSSNDATLLCQSEKGGKRHGASLVSRVSHFEAIVVEGSGEASALLRSSSHVVKEGS
mmetsp:Transcript_24311/g.61642  ORF Transcript_24311/g.61642 Transcript_24311/m.61642 type:complete len:225 (-) Transcript_24311:685-1359(-)